MRLIGLFEAKTKFTEICEEVSRSHEPVIVTRHGKAIVRIAPVDLPTQKDNVWAARRLFEETHGPLDEEIMLPSRGAKEDSGV